MKFTKDEAYKELVSQMTAKGEKLNLSQRSINEQLDALMPLLANEETELADFVTKVLPVFKTSDANVRNDVSQGINQYKADNPPTKGGATEPDPAKQTSDANAQLLERLEAMERELANAKKEQQSANIRKDIASKLKDKGVADDDWVKCLLSEITITDDFDVDGKVESYLNLYNKSKAKVGVNAVPDHSGGGKSDLLGDAIKKAAQFAKSQNLVE